MADLAALPDEDQFLSRRIDHLGDLGAKLRDLTGFATLARELIQNADDAKARSISFDVRDEALVVDNSGVFSECEDVRSQECSWKDDPAIAHRCDFHRFRLIAGQDKRNEGDTTGAFGFGFTAVYQITDHPELISVGHHWIMREDQPEDRRIRQCPGCPACRAGDLPGTRFILPWARDPNTTIRNRLGAEPVSADTPDALLQDLERTIPTAILFLRHLDRVEVRENGRLRRSFERRPVEDGIRILDGESSFTWQFISGDFAYKAVELRQRHGSRIEPARSSRITIAIPEAPIARGLLYAYLPTQHETGLPFHVHADFYPASGRKTVIFDDDYQSEWNRAALLGAAQAFRDSLPTLPERLGHRRLWSILQSLHKVWLEAANNQRERALTSFWNLLTPALPTAPIMLTTRGETLHPSGTVVLQFGEDHEATPVFEALGLDIVHQDLRDIVLGLPFSNIFGIRQLDIDSLITSLEAAGLDRSQRPEDLPAPLNSLDGLSLLWKEIGRLLDRRKNQSTQQTFRTRFASCAIAPAIDGLLHPCGETYWAGERTVALFSQIDSGFAFLADLTCDGADVVRSLCSPFTSSVAVSLLREISPSHLEALVAGGSIRSASLLSWFAERQLEIIDSPHLRQSVAALPIYPAASGFHPLSGLSLPGDFEDPLGLANLVDLDGLSDQRPFLKALGANELTIQIYARDHVPRALDHGSAIDPEKKRRLVRLLADNLGRFRDDDPTQQALCLTSLVECEGDAFHPAYLIYFRNEVTSEVLGRDACYATLPDDHRESIRDLYRWLGVTEAPRPADIVARVRLLTRVPPSDSAIRSVQRILGHLCNHLKDADARHKRNDPHIHAFDELRSLAWLPAREDARGSHTRWHAPSALHAIFQAHLFESQAAFLDLRQPLQIAGSEFLKFLGVNLSPSVLQVVRHLLTCAEKGEPVNRDVYRFLNDNADDPPIDLLKNKPCLLLPSGSYLMPEHVFWQENPFGRYRFLLGEEMIRYQHLLKSLEVRDRPSAADASKVLLELSPEHGHRRLDDDSQAVLLACWQLLDRALSAGAITPQFLAELREREVVLNAQQILARPDRLFFEDRAGLASKFSPLLDNDAVPRPEGAWRAMLAAGVQLLSEAVSSHLLECEDDAWDSHLAGLLQARRLQLARVFEAQDPDLDGRDLASRVAAIEVHTAAGLTVQFTVRAFNRVHSSQPEPVPAHYLREANILYVVRRNGAYPWPAIAREFALAIRPGAEPGQIAPGIKEVLAAATGEDARVALDELGFAPLRETVDAVPVGAEPIGGFGGQAPPEPEQETSSTPAQAPLDEEDLVHREEVPAPANGGDGDSVDDALRNILGDDAAGPTPMPGDPEANGKRRPSSSPAGPRLPSDRTAAGPNGSGTTRRSPRAGGLLRTYVFSGDRAPRESPEAAERRRAVGQAAVQHVIAFELSAGRFPEEMPLHNPGYDVVSRDGTGQVVRYIEVKGCSGDWNNTGVAVTDTEFEKAEELGDLYWLYVVERAPQQDFRIFRIQDPARRVNRFIYNQGWNELAEADPAPSSDPGRPDRAVDR